MFRNIKNIFFFFLLTFNIMGLYSQTQKRLTYSQISALSVKPVNERNYAGQECCFELKLPYTKADTVQASIPDLQNGVSFVSMRRSDYSEDETGTKIELWLNFSEPGRYRIRVMRIMINGKNYPIPFEPVVIYENPKNILPQLVIDFDNGVELIQQKKSKARTKAAFTCQEGSLITFTVYLQYAVQLASFYWTVPKDSLFNEVKRYDITKGTLRSSDFSEEKIPIATFEWQPLVKGQMPLPEMKFMTTSYNGTRVELNLPEAFISVTEGIVTEDKAVDFEGLFFSNAFDVVKNNSSSMVKSSLLSEDCQKIADLRAQERHSFPFGEIYKQRKELEKSFGISSDDYEPSFIALWVFLSLAFLSLVFLVAFILVKKVSGIIINSAFLLFFSVLFIVVAVKLKVPEGIFIGGKISPVPENSVEAVESISSGKKVVVEQKAGPWIFVRYENSTGWTNSENVIMINK